MTQIKSSKENNRSQVREIMQALGPAFGPAVILLSPMAFLRRIQGFRSPFSPTLYKRRRPLPKASLTGRHLSNEPYLRPTIYCNCHAPQMIFLADQFRSESGNDWDYAIKAYNFVRNEIAYAIEPFPRGGAVGTIENRCGFCIDKTNALIALARAGGIPARYCQLSNMNAYEGDTIPWVEDYANHFQTWQESSDWRLRMIGRGFSRRLDDLKSSRFENAPWVGKHLIAELRINNSWILADPTWSDQEAIAFGMPLPRLGYDPIALFGFKGHVVDRSEVFQVEKNFWIRRWILSLLARGLLDIANQAFEEKRREGQRLLDEIGEKEYIRLKLRYYVPLPQAVGLKFELVA
jgi:hypothetical protein